MRGVLISATVNCISHNLFDGLSVDKGLGGGNFFLLPVNLDECLAIMRNAKGKKIDYIQVRRDVVHSCDESDLAATDVSWSQV